MPIFHRLFWTCGVVGSIFAFGIPAHAAEPRETKGIETRPNIVWIAVEDLSNMYGCYGDKNAHTPNLDHFASQGARFTRAFTHAPVCAPSRSGLITGIYPITLGSEHMRSKLVTPPEMFTTRLKAAGYFVDWPGKTDFNFDVPVDSFDSTADWTKTEITKRPFFAYINEFATHEGQARLPADEWAKRTARVKPEERADPAKMKLPPYYPDTPIVRRNVANYYDLMTAMDYDVQDALDKLDRMGVADNTLVFIFADHGWGMPRGKRFIYDSGIQVPLLIRWPGTIKPGTVRDDLVCFIDFAPTVLAVAGANPSPAMPGENFLDPNHPRRKYIFAARDRMDEAPDRIRCVRGERYKLIHNFRPDLPYAQYINYMDEMPAMQEWRRLNAEGKLVGPQKLFFAKTKPKEELYDTQTDPYEIHNLIDSPEHQKIAAELRAALDKWIVETKDTGAFAESDLILNGRVKDVLQPYAERAKLHPKASPTGE